MIQGIQPIGLQYLGQTDFELIMDKILFKKNILQMYPKQMDAW